MERFGNIIDIIDFTLDTKRKKHIVGGILISVSLMFGGLALTAMTIHTEDETDE